MPLRPQKPCNKHGCSSLTRTKYCEVHERKEQQEKRDRHRHYDNHNRNQKSKAFYKSNEWAMARRAALIRDHFLCRRCLDNKKLKKADVVDHAVPIQVDWDKRLFLNNLQSLCHACHNRKTADDKEKYKG